MDCKSVLRVALRTRRIAVFHKIFFVSRVCFFVFGFYLFGRRTVLLVKFLCVDVDDVFLLFAVVDGFRFIAYIFAVAGFVVYFYIRLNIIAVNIELNTFAVILNAVCLHLYASCNKFVILENRSNSV